MTLSPNDLKETIYIETSGTLASRIDYAWEVYSQQNSMSFTDEDKKNALKFLIYAFDIQHFDHINKQLITLMDDRNKYKAHNEEYIPKKSPKFLTLSQDHGYSLQMKINEAICKKELLQVNAKSRKLDMSNSTLMFDSEKRGEQRVHISQGLFCKNGYLFDTKKMESHGKPGYAAYTLNVNGELSVFNHYGMTNGIAHSSMNAGAPVIAAGELKIEGGQLIALTTHSGHYQPTLFNVYRALEYFVDNDVDISETKVNLHDYPGLLLPQNHYKREYFDFYKKDLYVTDASAIYTNIKKTISDSIKSIKAEIKAYHADVFTNTIYRVKDLIIGSDLTKRRNQLAKEFEQAIKQFKQGMIVFLPEQLELKIRTLSQLITKIEQKNNKLSISENKPKNTGRLAKKIGFFKDELSKLSDKTKDMGTNDSVHMKTIR